MITADEARERLAYDSETGVLTWRKSVPGRKAGSIAGTRDCGGYVQISIGRKQYRAHHLAWLMVHGEWPAAQLDHINRIRDDNRLCNLRPAEPWQNQANTSMTADASGVWWDKKAGKWQVAMRHKRQRLYLGSFTNRALAEQAYRIKARELRGEFYAGPRALEAHGPLDGSD